MTKEKALEIFKFMLKSGKGTIDYWNGTIAEQRAAIEMAIKALEQEPSDDCVSRQELYKSLYERFHDEDAPNNITTVTLGSVRNFVKDFPPVTPTRKVGKWIELEDFDCSDRGEYLVKCSICDSCNGYDKSNYCPNCGTEMRGAEND